MVKRFVDIVVSALLLLLALPVLLLAALLIRLTSPGPVLFRQTRMGRGFEPFEILKLRTMAHAEAGFAYTLGPDPRITPFGMFLRRSKIDELPQLWNVLRGQMSLVGPRPVLPELTYEFQDFYIFLLAGRPGLTDPASLKYSQETRLLAKARDPLQFFKTVVTPDKIRISFEYMRQANLWSDLKTLAMTGVICCVPSLSRVYGELPAIPNERVTEMPQPKHADRVAALQVDDSIFAYELAQMEAEMGDGAPAEILPWIPLPNENLSPRSIALGAKGRGTRL